MYLTDKGRWVDICRPELVGHGFFLSQSQQLLLPLRFSQRGESAEEGGARPEGDSSSSSPPGPGYRRPENRLTFFYIHPMFTLVRSLFIQCSLLTLRFFGWRTTDSFLMSFPLVRIIRRSYTPMLLVPT